MTWGSNAISVGVDGGIGSTLWWKDAVRKQGSPVSILDQLYLTSLSRALMLFLLKSDMKALA